MRRGMRVLIVDDSQTMRLLQRAALEQLGHECAGEAANGAEALDMAETCSPELILLDLRMPVMDGLTFVKAFRQRDRHTPVIVVTSETEKPRVIEAFRLGVTDFLVKPFTPDSLARRIDDTTRRAAG